MDSQRRTFLGTLAAALVGLPFPGRKGETTYRVETSDLPPYRSPYPVPEHGYYYDWQTDSTNDPQFKGGWPPFGLVNGVYLDGEDIRLWYIYRIETGQKGRVFYSPRLMDGNPIVDNRDIRRMVVEGKVEYRLEPEAVNRTWGPLVKDPKRGRILPQEGRETTSVHNKVWRTYQLKITPPFFQGVVRG